jgi:hypothetical protein
MLRKPSTQPGRRTGREEVNRRKERDLNLSESQKVSLKLGSGMMRTSNS